VLVAAALVAGMSARAYASQICAPAAIDCYWEHNARPSAAQQQAEAARNAKAHRAKEACLKQHGPLPAYEMKRTFTARDLVSKGGGYAREAGSANATTCDADCIDNLGNMMPVNLARY
jgi:hypothetical protein